MRPYKMKYIRFYHRSIRLRGYDYSKNGIYYVTICVQYHGHIFGNIIDRKMQLNEPGKMVEYWWNEIPNKFPSVKLGKYEIMPNHLHGIIFVQNVGADLCIGPNKTLGNIIQWFKIMTTNDYIIGVRTKNWPVFPKHLWQRNYFERIIRNEEELAKIEDYIQRNPGNWGSDPENRRSKVM